MLALVALLLPRLGAAAPTVTVTSRPTIVYSTVTPKLRLQGSGFGTGTGDNLHLQFIPKLDPDAYKVSITSDTVLSLNLKPGFAWPSSDTGDDMGGTTLYLTEFKDDKKGAANLLDEPVAVATVIPTPTVMDGGDKVIYMTGTTVWNINGTNFRSKAMALSFEPALERDVDYILSVRSSTCLQLTLKTGRKWRTDADPGPLKLKRLDTGGGALRIDARYGGVTVAEVQVDLGPHGVTVETASETRLYQTQPTLNVLGAGFNSSAGLNTLKWGNALRGKGLNYTISSASTSQLQLSLTAGSKWRQNPANLPGPLVLMAVNAGAGLVPVGPTEAKKGRVVATIFEDPAVDAQPTRTVYMTHTHELWVTGAGFTRGAFSTKFEFDPPLAFGVDYVFMVFNRTHVLVSLLDGRAWAKAPGILRVTAIDTGAGPVRSFKPVPIAHVANDADDHPSGVTVTRFASQALYQTAALRKLLVTGSGFCASPELSFQPPLTQGVDYKITKAEATQLSLALLKGRKWRYEAGPLYLAAMTCGKDRVEFAYGQGIVVSTILADPTVSMSERKIYATHTRRLVIQGTGFSLDGTELTLRPTSRAAYEIESIETTEMVLLLKEGKSWADAAAVKGKEKDAEGNDVPVTISVVKVDTGAGEVVLGDNGVTVARVFVDPEGAVCDDSCEWALDGVCDDGSSEGRTWEDDDQGGFYAYDDDYYGGYGYYYEDDDDALAPVCEAGTDCTDCGGADPGAVAVDCSNTCQWANDGYCDDTRTSSLCDLGTDCKDCGPASAGNFTTWDDDGWWDDDENYWDDDYDFEDYEPSDDEPHVAFIKSTRNPRTRNKDMNENKGVGGIFMMLLEGIVVGIGCFMCAVGSFFAYRFFKGEKLPFELLPQEDYDLSEKKAAAVPLTPDVTYSGK